MSDEHALLLAIHANPDEDTPRLMYADWLQENGQSERAEFIRIECEQATICSDPETAPNTWESPRYWELDKRRGELYDRHAAKWFAPLFKAHRGEMSTHRGFPYHVALTARKFIDSGDALFRTAPTIEDVFIDRLGRNMPELAQTPALGHVRKLTFFETPFWEAEAESLAASPYLGNLRELSIPFTDTQIGTEGAAALANAQSLKQLRHLDLYNHAIYDAGADELFSSRRLATLLSIHLGNNGLTDDSLVSLSEAGDLKLTSLDLKRNHFSGSGLLALNAPHLAGLENLSIQGNSIGHTGAVNLTQMPFVSRLRNLQVSDCDMDDTALATLLGAEWPKLNELSLTMNPFGSRAAKALATNGSLRQLKTLSVARCGIGVTAARVLGRAPLPALEGLYADNNPLGLKGVRALLSGSLVAQLRTLHLGETELADEGAELLARCPAVVNVRSLWLQKNQITDRGALALAESPHLAQVQSLYMSENKVGKKGRDALVRRFEDRVDLDDE